MPINAMLGVFMDSNAPNTTAAPAARDYSTAASRDRASYDDIQNKQPFFIGDGMTSGGQTQTFLVPPAPPGSSSASWTATSGRTTAGPSPPASPPSRRFPS